MSKPTRLMVFYDGSFFKQGQIFFRYKEQRGWFSLPQLHLTLEKYVAQKAKSPIEMTKVVAAHYYDGRPSTRVADSSQLQKDRDFEMALINAGIVTHFLPLREIPRVPVNTDDIAYRLAQKGVDVKLALDVLDYAHTDRFDIAVLVTGDEDFVPLVNKITSLGKQALIAHFQFDGWSTDGYSNRPCRASSALLEAATFTLNFNSFVQDRDWRTEVNSLFFMPRE